MIILKILKKLQHIIFPQLKILKFEYRCPKYEYLTRFLEINGKNLEEIYILDSNDSLNLVIASYCPNLRSLYAKFTDNEVETLKIILNCCQQLKSIKVRCNDSKYLNENDLLKVIAENSPKNFHELKICYTSYSQSDLLPEELEFFFISWTTRIPQKSLSLVLIDRYNKFSDENMKTIEKYIELGIINLKEE